MTTPPPRDRMGTDTAWQRWGEVDPYFGVITDERYRRNNLTPAALAEFFRSGRSHVAHVMRVCQQQFSPTFVPQRVLDFGCGVGRVLVAFAEKSPEVVGVDVSPAMLAEARRNCDERGLQQRIELVRSDDALSEVEGTFDLIHSVIVFQHIEPARGHGLVARLVERLRPGGIAALHFTYAKTAHADRYGQPPPPATPPPPPAPAWRLAKRRPPAPPPQPAGSDPEMQMNSYPLNEIMFIAQQGGARRCHVEFTDHGGECGVFLYFQRSVR